MHGAAKRVRRELAAAARHRRVEWSFEIARLGADAPLGATTERDLIVVAALTRPIGRHFWVEWHWWSSVEQIPGQFLSPSAIGTRVGRSSPVIRDQGAGSARLLVMAARLAEAVASP
jgi:hypothetical protein